MTGNDEKLKKMFKIAQVRKLKGLDIADAQTRTRALEEVGSPVLAYVNATAADYGSSVADAARLRAQLHESYGEINSGLNIGDSDSMTFAGFECCTTRVSDVDELAPDVISAWQSAYPSST